MEKFNETEMSILRGLKDALSFAKNESNDTKVHKIEVKNIDVKELSEKSDLTQETRNDANFMKLKTELH